MFYERSRGIGGSSAVNETARATDVLDELLVVAVQVAQRKRADVAAYLCGSPAHL